MKKPVLVALTFALLVHWAVLSRAKDEKSGQAERSAALKPIAVLSIASYDKLLGDVGHIGKLSDNPEVANRLEGMLAAFTQGQGLNGLDKKRPWGLVLNTDESGQFLPLAFLPASDFKQLINSFAPLLGEPRDIGEGLYEIQAGGQKLFTKEHNGWAVVGQTADAFAGLPDDPSKFLAELHKHYDIALRLYVQNIPEVFRSMFIDQLQAGAQAGLERNDNEDEEQFTQRKKMVQDQLQSMQSGIQETDKLTIGLNVDRRKNVGYLDLFVSALAGTKTARQFAENKNVTTDYAGFLTPGAAATLSLTTRIAPEDISKAVSTLATVRSNAMSEIDKSDDLPDDASKKLAKDLIGQVLDAVQKTVQDGKLDGGARLLLDDKRFTVVAGGYVSDPASLEDSLKKIDELAKKEPKYPGIKFNAQEHGDVKFHTVALPVPEKEELSRIVGSKLDVVVGIGPKSLFVAAGADPAGAIREVIDRSKQQPQKRTVPMELTISMEPVLRFAAHLRQADEDGELDESTKAKLAMMTAELAKSPGKDRVRIVAQPIKNGARYRFLFEEGMLRVLGQALTVASNAAGLQAVP